MHVFGQDPRLSSAARVRWGLATFFAALAIGSALLEYTASRASFLDRPFVSIYMWWVTGAAVLAHLLVRDQVRDWAFRWPGWAGTRAVLVGTSLPLVVGLAAYGVSWGTGIARFSSAGISSTVFGIAISGPPPVRFLKLLLLNLTVGALWSCKSAAGEEIGWRGYMLPRLMASGVRAPITISGLVWALWHLPLIFGGQFNSIPHSTASICIFAADIIGQGYILAWMRLSSGSIWPCIWTHGLWNQLIGRSFDAVTEASHPWLGESGVITTAVVIVFAAVLYTIWPLRQVNAKKVDSRFDQG